MHKIKNQLDENGSNRNINPFISQDDPKRRPLRIDQSLSELNSNSARRPCSQNKHLTANEWSAQELNSLEDKEATQIPTFYGRSANSSTQQMYLPNPVEAKKNSIFFKHKGAQRKMSKPAQQSNNFQRNQSFYNLSQSGASAPPGTRSSLPQPQKVMTPAICQETNLPDAGQTFSSDMT